MLFRRVGGERRRRDGTAFPASRSDYRARWHRGMLVRAHRDPTRPDAFDLVQGHAVRLPVPDESVDVRLSLGVLCCMTDEEVPFAVSETWRVLRPGGLAVVGVPLRRGNADDPLFRKRGFERVARLRPGRSLHRRPSAGTPVGPI